MSAGARLVAVGGGGFTHQADPALEEFILAEAGMPRPRIGFIGTASRDDPVKIARFHARFADVAGRTVHLPPGATATDARRFLAGLDILYVGGGNTLDLLRHWRESGIADLLQSAARDGLLLSGVSAGAVCWFDFALSDSAGIGLGPLAGLGLFAGSCCPHYSAEPARPPAYRAAIAGGLLPAGIAIDDGVAVLVDATGPRRTVSARPGAWAYRIRKSGKDAVTERLPAGSG